MIYLKKILRVCKIFIIYSSKGIYRRQSIIIVIYVSTANAFLKSVKKSVNMWDASVLFIIYNKYKWLLSNLQDGKLFAFKLHLFQPENCSPFLIYSHSSKKIV